MDRLSVNNSTTAATVTILLAIALSALPSAGDFPVLDGARQATVVHPAEATDYEQQAYQELASYLQKATEQQFAIVAEAEFVAQSGSLPIYVGNCQATQQTLGNELAKLDRDAFIIVIEEDRAFLTGARDWSTYWAVCQFLEDYVGVRWLIPGPLGEDILPQEQIAIAPVKRVEQPVILSRQWSGANYAPGGGLWSLRMRIHGRYGFHHNLQNIFDPEKYYDDHPEYFPIHGGKRYRPRPGSHGWQPCMTEPGTAQVAADAARQAWDADPELESYSFGTADGSGFCQCPQCQALTEPDYEFGGYPTPYSRLYFTWLSSIADELDKTHPDKLLGTLAYSNRIAPPQDIELDRSILPYITFTIADSHEARFRDSARRLVEIWGNQVDQIGFYDYAYGLGNVLPRIYTQLIQDTIQHGVQHNLRAMYSEVYPNWGLDGPRLYLTARIWWNPDVDTDALFNDWNERMFREAADPMKTYFRRCEEAWYAWDGGDQWETDFAVFMRTPPFEVYTPEIVAELTGYLDEAARLAQSDLAKERIHFFRKTWDLGVLFAEAYWSAEQARNLLAGDRTLAELATVLRTAPEAAGRAEWEQLIRDRVGDDPIALFPMVDVKPSWIPIPAAVTAQVYAQSAELLTPAAVYDAAAYGLLSGPMIRRVIDRRISEVFGTDGPEHYQDAVAQIRRIAMTVTSVKRTALAPQIDGVLDDELWARVSQLDAFTVRGDMTVSNYPTVARLTHDERNLYVALVCYQDTSDMVVDAAERDEPAWKDDCVEIFVRSDRQPESWAQLVINPAGTLFDQWVDETASDLGPRISYDFDCEWAAHIQPDRWTAELRIPLAEMGISPADDPILRMNFVRNVVGGSSEVSTWRPQPTYGGHAALFNQGWVILH